MQVFEKKSELKNYLSAVKAANKTIGFIPTMGALHQGHLSLVTKAAEKNDLTVVSIFVNPTQFNNPSDLENYPKTLSEDMALLESVDCSVLFLPSVSDMYAETVTATSFDFDGIEHEMEGQFREGHFDGVGTIVKALFECVTPTASYFGEKDFQQLQIVKKLAEKHHLPVVVEGCEIYREADGLAMSSRNKRLSKAHRMAAPFIYKTLQLAQERFETHTANEVTAWVEAQFENRPLLCLEYFTIADETTLKAIETPKKNEKYRAFIAVFAEDVRLIDNIQLNEK